MIHLFMYIQNSAKRQQLHGLLGAFSRKTGFQIEISETSSLNAAKEFILERKESNVLLLDFEDPKDGYQLARCLRQLDPLPAWVFVNGAPEFLYQTLFLRPSGYVPDSSDGARLEQVLNRILKEHATYLKTTHFSFKYQGEIIRIPFSDIQYLESHGKKVMLHLYKDTHQYEFTGKLEDVLATFPACFLRCHQSYGVNTDFIKDFHAKTQNFVLLNGDSIPISRRLFKTVQEKYLKA